MEKRVLLWEKEAVKENSKGTPEELWHREQMQTTWHSYFPGLRRVKGSLGTARPWRTFEKHIDTRLTLRRCGTAKVSSPNFQGSVLRAPVGIVFSGRLNLTDQSAHQWATNAAGAWMLQFQPFYQNKQNKKHLFVLLPWFGQFTSKQCGVLLCNKSVVGSGDLLLLLFYM